MPDPGSSGSRRWWMALSAQSCAAGLLFATAPHAVLAANEAAGWSQAQKEISTLVAGCQYDKALQRVTEFISANPTSAAAYEQRIWVTLDWLDLRDEVSLTDTPLRRRTLSDPVTGLGNVDKPIEVRRQFLDDQFREKYTAPPEFKSVEADVAECRRLAGKSFNDRAVEAFMAEFIGNYSRAKELVSSRCADGTAAPREYLVLSRVLRTEGNLSGALAMIDKAWPSPETRSQASSRKVMLLKAMGQMKPASDFFDQWEDTSSRDPRFLAVRVAISLEKEQPIKDLERLMAVLPREAAFAYGMSIRDVQFRNDTKACMDHLNQSIELNQRSLLPYYARSCVKLKLGDAQGALADATAAVKCNPYFDMSYQVRARVYRKQGNLDLAHQDELHRSWLKDLYTLYDVVKKQPQDTNAALNLGKHYARGHEWNRALQMMSVCLKRDPNHADALRQRSQIYLATNKLDLALADADRAIEIDGDPAGYSLRGDVYAQKKDWDAAISDFESARCLDDRLENALRKRAAQHKAAGRIEAAQADLERAGSVAKASFTPE